MNDEIRKNTDGKYPSERWRQKKERNEEISRIKIAINTAIPVDVRVTSIIKALAELQRDMVDLLEEE